MKLASLKSGRDGQLVVVSRDLREAVSAAEVAATLQAALDDWDKAAAALQSLYEDLCAGKAAGSFPFDPSQCDAPLPRAYHWADGSAYVTHVELVRKARGAELPESFWRDPLVYMGGLRRFHRPPAMMWRWRARTGVSISRPRWWWSPMTCQRALARRRPVSISSCWGLVNDVSLRNLIPAELGKQFGFYQSKPWTSFTPVLVTPDELGSAWDGAKLSLPLRATLNGKLVGAPNAGVDMTFDFPTLIAPLRQVPLTDGGNRYRFRHGIERRQQGRFLLPGGSALPGNHRTRRPHYPLHVIWRPHRDRDAGRRRRVHFRPDRPGSETVSPAALRRGPCNCIPISAPPPPTGCVSP